MRNSWRMDESERRRRRRCGRQKREGRGSRTLALSLSFFCRREASVSGSSVSRDLKSKSNVLNAPKCAYPLPGSPLSSFSQLVGCERILHTEIMGET